MAHASKWINASGDESVTEVATRSLKSRLEPVQRFLPLAAMSYEEDIEYVHNLRVWTRRADAALEMYSDLLPEWRSAWIQKQLARIRKATNDARDDDVFAKRLAADDDDDAAAGQLLKRVREHRVEAQKSIRDIHKRLTKKKGRFDRRVEKLLQRVRLRGKMRRSKEPTYRVWADRQLRLALDDFFDMANGDLKDTEHLHQLRITGKNLRYAMELLSAAFGSDLRKQVYPLLETLQDKLGIVNDHASALGRIESWLTQNDDPKRDKFLREMLESEQEQLKESRRAFSNWWSDEQRERLSEAFSDVLAASST